MSRRHRTYSPSCEPVLAGAGPMAYRPDMGVRQVIADLLVPPTNGVGAPRPAPSSPPLPAGGATDLRSDGALTSLLTGLGTKRDARTSIQPGEGTRHSKRDADRLRRFEWACRRFVEDLPAQAVRKPITLRADGDREDAAKKILDRLEELEARPALRKALEWERQYGGALLILLTSDGAKAEEPLDLTALEAVRGFEVVSRWRVVEPTKEDLETEPSSERYGLPKWYRLASASGQASRRIHWTRVIVFRGHQAEEPDQPWAWGASELDTFWPAARDYQGAIGHSLALMARGSETILKTKGLRSLLAKGDREILRDYLASIQEARSSLKIWALDKEDEATEVAPNLSGAKDLVAMARENLAGAWGRSLASLFGTPRQGLGNSDESGSERDDAVVAQYREDKLRVPWNRLVELVVAELGLAGVTTWQVGFPPLREETPRSRSERREIEARTAALLYDKGVLDEVEIRAALRGDTDSPFELLDDDERPEPEPDERQNRIPGG